MLTDTAMRDRMRKGWRAGLPFTVCGHGSLPQYTAKIRGWIPSVITERGIKTVSDAGAGDMQWCIDMDWAGAEVTHYDLFPRAENVTEFDITAEVLPKTDAILCRMVLNHLVDVAEDGTRNEGRIELAIEKFRESGSRYLITTQFNGEDLPQRSPQFSRLDLRPILGDYLDASPDGSEESHCRLALWEINA